MNLNELIPEIKVDEASVIKITDRTVRFGETVYQVRNITGVSVAEYRSPPRIPVIAIAFCGVIGIYLLPSQEIEEQSLSFFLITVAAIGAVERFFLRTQYFLQLEMNSGRSRLFLSSRKDFLTKVVKKIYEVMDSNDPTIIHNYTVDLSTKHIRDHSTRIEVGGSVGGNIIGGDVRAPVQSHVGGDVSFLSRDE